MPIADVVVGNAVAFVNRKTVSRRFSVSRERNYTKSHCDKTRTHYHFYRCLLVPARLFLSLFTRRSEVPYHLGSDFSSAKRTSVQFVKRSSDHWPSFSMFSPSRLAFKMRTITLIELYNSSLYIRWPKPTTRAAASRYVLVFAPCDQVRGGTRAEKKFSSLVLRERDSNKNKS